jgi:hypothetical protein
MVILLLVLLNLIDGLDSTTKNWDTHSGLRILAHFRLLVTRSSYTCGSSTGTALVLFKVLDPSLLALLFEEGKFWKMTLDVFVLNNRVRASID